MTNFHLKRISLLVLNAFIICFSATSCTKSGTGPGGIPKPGNYGTHSIDQQLAGDWLWTSVSDLGNYDDNGTWQGSGYGFAYKVSMDANDNGILYSHVHSNLGPGSNFEVNIYYVGYYELDENGTLTFYSMGGRYTNSDGVNRALSGDELYNQSTGTGRTVYFSNVSVTTYNNRPCFISVENENVTDVFYKQ